MSLIHFVHFSFVYFNLPGSGLQDIRNIIPFSGKGFVLGGNSQSSASSPTCHKQVAPVANTSSSNAIFSPKKLFAPSSPNKALGSPVHSNLDDKGKCNTVASTRSPTVAGLKPPVKKSVGNAKAFVNINGSPVKIPKPQSNANNKDAKKARQKSIEDLFSIRKPSETLAEGSAVASCDSSTPDRYLSVKGSHGGPAEQTESKYFNHSSSSNGSASRKRAWDVHNNSASIFDFFQKKMSSDLSLSVKPSAAQQTEAAATSAATTSSGPSSSTASSSSSSAALMVSCPVCQAKVHESKINEHLDSCLT